MGGVGRGAGGGGAHVGGAALAGGVAAAATCWRGPLGGNAHGRRLVSSLIHFVVLRGFMDKARDITRTVSAQREGGRKEVALDTWTPPPFSRHLGNAPLLLLMLTSLEHLGGTARTLAPCLSRISTMAVMPAFLATLRGVA